VRPECSGRSGVGDRSMLKSRRVKPKLPVAALLYGPLLGLKMGRAVRGGRHGRVGAKKERTTIRKRRRKEQRTTNGERREGKREG
jgi:hypothetical protein